MGLIFFVLGWVSILGGAGWIGFVVYDSIRAGGSFQPSVLADLVLASASAALALIALGFALMAIAGVLGRLDRIVRNTGDTADAVEALLNRRM